MSFFIKILVINVISVLTFEVIANGQDLICEDQIDRTATSTVAGGKRCSISISRRDPSIMDTNLNVSLTFPYSINEQVNGISDHDFYYYVNSTYSYLPQSKGTMTPFYSRYRGGWSKDPLGISPGNLEVNISFQNYEPSFRTLKHEICCDEYS